ncbi:MAG: pectinesterase family protein [Dysgonomonas sp.]|nr:pectinesterase family protein [Dysgonomonas sp.]
MKRVLFFLIVFLNISCLTGFGQPITIFTIGDSTMADKDISDNKQERGWGHMLPAFFDNDYVVVENHAVNGQSSKSFIDGGRWEKVRAKIKKGDYVFIQFGHNDEKENEKKHTNPGTTFDANLRKFVKETKEKGGIPVLFNSIVRRKFNEQGILTDTHGDYLKSPENVAKEQSVAFIDMNKITHDLVQELGPESSKSLFMWVGEKQDDTHLNVKGGRLIARLAVEAITKEVPALAQYARYYDFVVAKDGSGNFFHVQDAINAVPDFRKSVRTTILVRKGTYKEKIIVPASKINVAMTGENGSVLTYDGYASKPNIFGENMSTSGSSSCYIYGDDFSAENITFENSSGPVGQAVACFVDGDRAFFKNCRFLGFQDTLYTYGKNSRQYYENCYIEGSVDFIFGWATAVFNNCTIHSLLDGYVTAPSTDKGKAYGYIFYDCTLTAAEGVDKVYLSRPWRPYGQAVFIRCDMGKHITPEGWNNWGKKENEKTAYYAEYQSRGEGANPSARAAFSHQLKNLDRYDIYKVLEGDDGWNPAKNGNALIEAKR